MQIFNPIKPSSFHFNQGVNSKNASLPPSPRVGGLPPFVLTQDAFVRFGNSAESVKSETPAQVVAKIIEGIKDLPGQEALTKVLKKWIEGEPWPEPYWPAVEKRYSKEHADSLRQKWTDNPWVMPPGGDEVALLNNISEQIQTLIQCGHTPPQTVVKAYELGLTKLFDDVLRRRVVPETQAQHGLLSPSFPGYKADHFEPYHIGKMGSDALLPLMESFLQTEDVEKLSSVFGALTWMDYHLNPKVGIQAAQLRDKYRQKEERVYLTKLEASPLATSYLLNISTRGESLEAVAAIARAWDATNNFEENINPKRLEGMTPDDISTKKREIREYILTAWMQLVGRGVGRALESIEARKTEIKETLKLIRENESDFDLRAVPSEKADVMHIGFFAESLRELPSITPPEGYDNKGGYEPWPYAEKGLSYFIPFIKMTQMMAARNVPGAKDKNEQLREELDDYLINELKQFHNGIPENASSYFYSAYNAQNIFDTIAAYSSTKVIPALQKLIEEPWHPTIQWGNTTNGDPQYTTDFTLMNQNKTIPMIQRTIEKIKYRTTKG
jgi:hypothetical protein